jgi:hypothetical protein
MITMVEIEENYKDRFGVFMDGNEPPANAVEYLTMRPGMDKLGMSENLRRKHQLIDYKIKRRLGKIELWRRLLAAQLEQELINSGSIIEEFDGFLLKPQSATPNSSYPLLFKGVTPTMDRRRKITYAQTVILCPPAQAGAAEGALRSLVDKLYFNPSVPEDYHDYAGFETECRQFLRYVLEVSQDKEAYEDITCQTGIKIYRILP